MFIFKSYGGMRRNESRGPLGGEDIHCATRETESEPSQLLYDCALLLRGEVMLEMEKERKMEVGYMH